MILRALWIVCLLIGSAGTALCQPPARASRAVIIVMDGCRADYLDLTDTPNLDALAARGVSYTGALVGHIVNDTPSGHASLVTGRLPRVHGVVAHEWHDVETGDWVHVTGLRSAVDDSLLRVYEGTGAVALSSRVKAARPGAYVASVSCGKFYAAMLMGGPDADEIICFPEDAPLEDGPRGPEREWTNLDTAAMTASLSLVRKRVPDLLMINLPDLDRMGHEAGSLLAPEVMSAVMANVDFQIGRLVELYRELGVLQETVFVVTADHGMVPSRHIVNPQSIVDTLGTLGIRSLSDHQHIWLADGRLAQAAAEGIARRGLERLLAVYYRTDGPVDAPYGRVTGLPISPELDAAYRWLIDTYRGAHAPDIVLALREDTVMNRSGRQTAFGLHTGFTWGAQHIPMILSGPGIVEGMSSDYPARLVDIASTVAALMGLDAFDTEGVVLADALIGAVEADRSRQSVRADELAPHRAALVAESAVDGGGD